jgi:hypothetical protein
MSPRPVPEALRQLRLRYQVSLAVEGAYLRAGFDVVLNDNILGEILLDFLALVPCEQLHLVFLDPDCDMILRRDRDREKTAYDARWRWDVGQLHQLLSEQTPRIGRWLDSSAQTPDQTVDTIFARLPESLVTANVLDTAR